MKNNKIHTNAEIIKLCEIVDLLQKELLVTKIQARSIYKKINQLK